MSVPLGTDYLHYPIVRLRQGADRRVRGGHLWIFSNELEDGFQSRAPGDLVIVENSAGKSVGVGSLNPHSLISVRLLSRSNATIDEEFLRERINRAISYRQSLSGGDSNCRLLYSESDGLPGLIVDRLADVAVVQSLTAGMERLLDAVVDTLLNELKPAALIVANDSPVRELEGLPLFRSVAKGEVAAPIMFQQDGIRFLADPIEGQKTGFFFDQRANRNLVGQFIRPGSRVLDLFCYTGAFGLYALQAGASHVTFVDESAAALHMAALAAEANGWQSQADFRRHDIFPWLSGWVESYDAVIVDPPALAKSRSKVGAALRAYRDLNARAMSRVNEGGILATSSCSGVVTPSAWRDSLRDAARKAGRRMRIIAQGSQAPDHPILSSMPETEYLKFVIALIDHQA
jgi:23S rRNA (cytosine1962-C5)-methyltransferase